MNDKAFLTWLLQRLIFQYGEDPNVDFVSKLASIASKMHPDICTPNVATDEVIARLLQEKF